MFLPMTVKSSGVLTPALLAISLFISAIPAAAASVVYTYDQNGRVATALYDNGTCVAYSYDAVGNRLSQQNSTSSSPETPVWGSGAWGCFAWSSAPLAAQRKRPTH